MRCWPAPNSRPARAAGGRRWISRRASSCGANWARPAQARTSASRRSPRSTSPTACSPTSSWRCWPWWPGSCAKAPLRTQARWIAGLALVAVRHGPVERGPGLAAGGRDLAHRRRRGVGGGADLGLVRERQRAVGRAGSPARGAGALGMSAAKSEAMGQPVASKLQQFYALTKPRVVQLIVFCALIGMVLAVPGVPTLADLRLAAHRLPGHLAGGGRRRRVQLPGGKRHRREDEAHRLARHRQGRTERLADPAVRGRAVRSWAPGCSMCGSTR